MIHEAKKIKFFISCRNTFVLNWSNKPNPTDNLLVILRIESAGPVVITKKVEKLKSLWLSFLA